MIDSRTVHDGFAAVLNNEVQHGHFSPPAGDGFFSASQRRFIAHCERWTAD